jgi:hypothetical protein
MDFVEDLEHRARDLERRARDLERRIMAQEKAIETLEELQHSDEESQSPSASEETRTETRSTSGSSDGSVEDVSDKGGVVWAVQEAHRLLVGLSFSMNVENAASIIFVRTAMAPVGPKCRELAKERRTQSHKNNAREATEAVRTKLAHTKARVKEILEMTRLDACDIESSLDSARAHATLHELFGVLAAFEGGFPIDDILPPTHPKASKLYVEKRSAFRNDLRRLLAHLEDDELALVSGGSLRRGRPSQKRRRRRTE